MKGFLISAALLLTLCMPAWAQEKAEEDKFLEMTEAMYAFGEKWSGGGYISQANWYYGHAYVAVASFRAAIADIANDILNKKNDGAMDEAIEAASQMDDDILSDFGIGSLGDLLSGLSSFTKAVESVSETIINKSNDLTEKLGGYVYKEEVDKWLLIKAKCLASPYTDFFRGLVLDWRGEDKEATAFYRKAAANPYFIGFVYDFRYLTKMSYEELTELSNKLAPYQVKYAGSMSSDSFYFAEDIETWNDKYLLGLAHKEIKTGDPDMVKVQEYVEAAFHANPFDVGNIYDCISVFTQARNTGSVTKYLNEALRMDPGNKALVDMIDKWNSIKDDQPINLGIIFSGRR